MTDADHTESTSQEPVASRSASGLMAHFLASPTGWRFRDCNPIALWEGLRPAIRLAAAIELAGLAERRALTVQYVGHGYEDARDDGRWLQLAKCFLPSEPRLEITMRTAPEVDRGRLATASSLSDFLAHVPPARRRAAQSSELLEPLRGKADLVIYSPRPQIDSTYRALSELVPSTARIVLADETDAVTLAHADFLAELGAIVDRQWVDALDDPQAPWDEDGARVFNGALLVHLDQIPAQLPTPDAWLRIQNLMPWAIRVLYLASKSKGHAPIWPGRRCAAKRQDGSILEVIVAHPQILIDAQTGEALDQPEGQTFQLPSEQLARHPGELEDARHRVRSLDLAWASEASAALEGCHAALSQLEIDLQVRIDEQLRDLGESPPPEMPTDLGGLFAAVLRDDHETLFDKIMLRRASPDQRGPQGITPLIMAARLGHTASLRVLLECHANSRLRDDHGWTAVVHAAYQGNMPSVAVLMRYPRSSPVTLGSGVPEIVVLMATLSAQRNSHRLIGKEFPDAAPVIQAWREGKLDEELISTFSLDEQQEQPSPQLQVEPRLGLSLPSPVDVLPAAAQPTTPLALAVRLAIDGQSPAPPPIEDFARDLVLPLRAPDTNRAADPVPDTVTPAPPVDAAPIEHNVVLPEPPPPTVAPSPVPRPATAPAESRSLGTMSVVATVAGSLGHLTPDAGPDAASDAAREAVLTWLRKDKGLPLPERTEEVFQLDLPHATILSDAVPGLWTLRYDDRDRLVAGRIWRTEIVIATSDERAFASMRLVRISSSSEDDTSVTASIPRLVSRVAARIGISDAGVPLRADPWVISSDEGIQALARLLLNPARLQPVLVVTSQDLAWIGDGKDPGSLVARLHGFAHLVAVHPEMTFTLSRELGRPLGVFGDACRLYRPGFTTSDDAQSNPLFLRRADVPARPLLARIVQAAARLAPARVTEEEVPTFAFARALMARSRQTAAGVSADTGPSAERAQALEQAIFALTAERDRWHQSYSERDAIARSREDELLLDRESLREEIDRLRTHNYHLRSQNDQLRINIARKVGTEPAPVTFPDTWDALETWSAEVLGDDVVLTNKAIRAARKSPFQNIPLAYQALHLLKEWYLPMRLDRSEATLEAFAARSRELGLEISDTGQAVEDRRFRDSYRASWAGRSYKLDQHISGSSSRDRSFQFRLYFAFDQDQGVVVVGSFPEHMDNSLTRH